MTATVTLRQSRLPPIDVLRTSVVGLRTRKLRAALSALGIGDMSKAVPVVNPMSEEERLLRTSLLPGLLRRGALTLEERYYGNARIFMDDQLRQVLRTYDPNVSHKDVTAQPYRESEGWDPVTRMQHVDLFTWLRGDILVKADKMTMANSLELRVPFLDPEVFRIASQVPSELKLTKETTKHAVRRTAP